MWKLNNYAYILAVLLFLPLISGCKQESPQNELSLQYPLGDGVHTEIHDFVVDYIKNDAHLTREQAMHDNQIAEQVDKDIAAGEILKPPIVGVYESSMSHILHIFCHHYTDCKSLAIYARNGQVIAAASKASFYTDYIIKTDLYNQYMDGALTKPYIDKSNNKTVYPIYLREDMIATHTKPKTKHNLIGFIIVYKKN